MSVTLLQSPQISHHALKSEPSAVPSKQSNVSQTYPYQYSRLDKSDIRILRILPGHADSDLQCSLRVVSLSDFDDTTGIARTSDLYSFEALSYVWGDATKVSQINCDGGTLELTQSLESALRRFRDPIRPRNVWADGLCINQQDREERASQVQLMGLIYWKARHVLIWLGHDDEYGERWKAHNAFRLVQEINGDYYNSVEEGMYIFREKYDIVEIQNGGDGDWEALRLLLMRPWFTRVWVVQEFGLARHATYYCGEASIDARSLQQTISLLMSETPWVVSYYGLYKPMLAIADAYYQSTRGDLRLERGSDPKLAENLLDILERARGLQCTDPRDMVFAFLGHPSAFKESILDAVPYESYPQNFYKATSPLIKPDYSEENTPLDSYFHIAYTALDNLDLGVEVLRHVGHDEDSIADLYPSWVPRWDVDECCTFFSEATPYTAGLGTLPTSFAIDFDAEDALPGLHIKAIYLGTVAFSRQIPNSRYFTLLPTNYPQAGGSLAPDSWNSAEELFHDVDELCASLPSAANSDIAALATTFTAGLPSDCEDVSQHVKNFRAYRQAKEVDSSRRDGLADAQSSTDVSDGDAHQYWSALLDAAPRRAFFGTQEGRLGLGPRITTGADEIWLPMGSKMPFVLRPFSEGRFKVLGEAYVHGMMRGEAVEGLTEDNFASIVLC